MNSVLTPPLPASDDLGRAAAFFRFDPEGRCQLALPAGTPFVHAGSGPQTRALFRLTEAILHGADAVYVKFPRHHLSLQRLPDGGYVGLVCPTTLSLGEAEELSARLQRRHPAAAPGTAPTPAPGPGRTRAPALPPATPPGAAAPGSLPTRLGIWR